MSLLLLTILIYISALGLQIAVAINAYYLLWQRQNPIARLFLIFLLGAFGIQSAHLLLSTFAGSHTQVSNALLYLGNALILWGLIFFFKQFLGRTEQKVAKLTTEIKFDPLTHVLSRSAILFYCEYELSKAQRTQLPISILIIDMDRFKQINDSYGHPIGDEVLVKSTRHCMRALREIDLIGRIGGDEFIILLPNTDYRAANEIAKRIREEMQTVHSNLSIAIPNPITLSIGIATHYPWLYLNHQQNANISGLLHELITLSDQSMYAEKKSNHIHGYPHRLSDEMARTG